MAQNGSKQAQMAQSRVKIAQIGSKWPKMAQNRPKMGVTEYFGAILSHFDLFWAIFGLFVSVWEQPWAPKPAVRSKWGLKWLNGPQKNRKANSASGAVVHVEPKPSAQSKRGSKWLNAPPPKKNNRKANSASGAVVHMVTAMGLHAIRQFPRLFGGPAA